MESSGGKYVNCPKGTFNGYGYAQNKKSWACYDNPEEPRQLVMNWFDNKLKNGFSLSEALCYYQSGIKSDSCIYSEKFNSI